MAGEPTYVRPKPDTRPWIVLTPPSDAERS